MADTLNCRCCGGELGTFSNLTVCKHCGTTNFTSDVANKNIIQLNHANRLRRGMDFDNAARIYDDILAENEPTADVLWYRTLCEYGIEYVPDPVSDKYFPTLHRIKDESILACGFYKQAVELSEDEQKDTLLKEAKYIDEVQTKYLNIAANEAPYDVFICYKETDLESGEKTEDVELADELYNELTRMGYKVFFARETLKEKLSVEYEPYIFAALRSAKAMAVIGTKAEYFTSVWVKNEWGRFLKLMEDNPEKQMFFACDDPEELPRAFAGKQAQMLGNEKAINNLAANMDVFLKDSKTGSKKFTVLSKEQELFDKILADKTDKFMADIDETAFGHRKKEIIKDSVHANTIAEKRYKLYKNSFDIGSIWFLLSNAISLIAFYVIINTTGSSPGGAQYDAQYYSVSLFFCLVFITIGLLILLSCNSWLISWGSIIFAALYVLMIISVKAFNISNTLLMIAIPLLILFIGFVKLFNRYYEMNKQAVEEARKKIQELSKLEEEAHKEYCGFAQMILNEYKRNYKASDDVQIKEYHYDNVKSLITESLENNVKDYSSWTDRNDSDFYENAKHRKICTIIYFAVATAISVGHLIIMISPNTTYEIARFIDAIY